MDLGELRERCLRRAGAAEGHPFGPGALVVKVGGKIFAIIAEDEEPLSISLKCDPDLALALRHAYAAVKPGYHLNKSHWNTVTLDGSVPDEQVGDWIDDSYDLVWEGLPHRVREDLGS